MSREGGESEAAAGRTTQATATGLDYSLGCRTLGTWGVLLYSRKQWQRCPFLPALGLLLSTRFSRWPTSNVDGNVGCSLSEEIPSIKKAPYHSSSFPFTGYFSEMIMSAVIDLGTTLRHSGCCCCNVRSNAHQPALSASGFSALFFGWIENEIKARGFQRPQP